jgi:hypothetical protein
MPSMPRARSLAVLACLAGAVPVVATGATPATASTASASSYQASSAATCKLSSSESRKPKGGYFLALRATGLGCTSAKKVMKHHDACRLKKGLKATCKQVDGYKCTEKRGEAIPTEFSATVTCKKSSKKVVYSYQQDT